MFLRFSNFVWASFVKEMPVVILFSDVQKATGLLAVVLVSIYFLQDLGGRGRVKPALQATWSEVGLQHENRLAQKDAVNNC